MASASSTPAAAAATSSVPKPKPKSKGTIIRVFRLPPNGGEPSEMTIVCLTGQTPLEAMQNAFYPRKIYSGYRVKSAHGCYMLYSQAGVNDDASAVQFVARVDGKGVMRSIPSRFEPRDWAKLFVVAPMPIRAFLLPTGDKPREVRLHADSDSSDGGHDQALLEIIGGWVKWGRRGDGPHGACALFIRDAQNEAGLNRNTNIRDADVFGPAIVVRGLWSDDLSSIPAGVQPEDWATLFEAKEDEEEDQETKKKKKQKK